METKKDNESRKREIIQYADLFFGLYNSFVMSFMILIISTNIIYTIITHVCIIILIAGMLLTFFTKNPFLLYFVLGALFCGAFYSLPGILIIPSTNFSYGIFDYIIFGVTIAEIFYLIIKTKDSALLETWGKLALIRERAQYDASLYYALENPELGRIHAEKAQEEEDKANMMRKEYNKQFKRNWIISISSISFLGYYFAYFSSFIL